MISREISSKFLGSLIVVSGIIILLGLMINLGFVIQNLYSVNIMDTIKFPTIIVITVFLIILGCSKIKKSTIKR